MGNPRRTVDEYYQEHDALSRNTLIRNYDAKSASRAKDARMQTQQAMYRQGRAAERRPLSAQESQDRARMSKEAHEHERALRKAQARDPRRTQNRDVIDGRGSIDSRAFNERSELRGYSIEDRDKPEPAIAELGSKGSWRSHAGQGFAASALQASHQGSRPRRRDLGTLSDTISGSRDYRSPKRGLAAVPFTIKFLVGLIIVLLIVLAILLFV